MGEFEVGNIYSRRDKFIKTYYIAISHRTLVTYKSKKFGEFTTKKQGYISENDISVSELCEFWNVPLRDFDHYMQKYFQPDEIAKQRARKEKEELELETLALLEL